MSSMQETWLWVGFAGMALGAVTIAFLGTRARAEDKHHFVASFFVTLIASGAYFAMAIGQGDITVGDRTIYFARYVDWVLTTPLLLLGLMLIGLPVLRADEGRSRNALVAGVIGADVFMILTGLFAALSLDATHRYVWYAFSCGAFLAVLGLIWGPVRQAALAQSGGTGELYSRLLTVLSALWFVYPVLWILGTEGTGTVSRTTEIFVFAGIDLSAKVGFGLLLVTGVLRLAHGTRAPRGVPSVEAEASPAPA